MSGPGLPLDALARPGAASVETPTGPVMVVRTAEGGVLAYRNACPHMGVRLSPDPRRLLTREGDRLICFGHGALFRPEDGFCVSGPCAGAALTPVPVRVEAGRIVLS